MVDIFITSNISCSTKTKGRHPGKEYAKLNMLGVSGKINLFDGSRKRDQLYIGKGINAGDCI